MPRVYPPKSICSVPECNAIANCRGWCRTHYRRWLAHGDPTFTQRGVSASLNWLKEQLENRERASECWEWPFCPSAGGYGSVPFEGRMHRANRVVLFLTSPRPQSQSYAIHSCDNPSCVNPTHLRWGTQQDNMNDKVARNRQPRGEMQSGARLTEEGVKAIRNDPRPNYIVAKEYGVDASLISRVRSRKAWTHVP